MESIVNANKALLRRVKLVTSPGLERALWEETKYIARQTEQVDGGRTFIDCQATLDSIWSIILTSRICESLWMYVCEPFVATNFKKFSSQINMSDWKAFIPFSAYLPKPNIKVLCRESKLYHTQMIEGIVNEIVVKHNHKSVQRQGDELPRLMKNRRCVSLCPNLMVRVDRNRCEVGRQLLVVAVSESYNSWCSVLMIVLLGMIAFYATSG